MQYKEFYDYVQELQNYYNQKLNETEMNIWYENLKFMTVQRFNLIISELYKVNKFMPKLSEVLDMHKQIPYTARTEEKKVDGYCEKCNDTGYVFYNKVVDGKSYQYVVVCDCGRQQRYDGTQCTDPRNKSKFYIPTASELGLEVKDSMPSDEEVIKNMNKLANSPIISEDIRNLIREEFRKRRVHK